MMTMSFVAGVVPGDLHAKRVESIAGAVMGILKAGSLAVSAIGKGYAAFNDGVAKHGVKQVDRMLSNSGIDLDAFFATWIPTVVTDAREVVLALDWTEFDRDGHSMLALTAMTGHGRATPVFWRTYKTSEFSDGGRTDAEDEVLLMLRALLPSKLSVTLVADRGFGDQALFSLLNEWGWNYVIRFRGNTHITDAKKMTKLASEWLSPSGRAKKLEDVKVTRDQTPVPAVVCVQAKGMKDAWFLATSLRDRPSRQIIAIYAKRFTIEETFRDLKDPRYGLGMHGIRVKRTDRRDRMTMLFAIAHSLLTLLGAASERIGYDRALRVNTVKKRTHSLFTQGKFYYECIPNMSDVRLKPLIKAYVDILRSHPSLSVLCQVP
ncbi:MAG: IS4 family transposase [Myxococcales bacterium]|nr:IS4 family transposase [Myxococcales bacterium]